MQEYRNHTQYVKGYHFVTLPLVIALLGGAIYNLVTTTKENLYNSSLIMLITVIICLLYYYARALPLRAQDRAIRAEESLRHYVLTGKPIDPQLRLGQIIALRFASDEELPELTRRAVAEKLRPKEIKRLVRKWRGDYHRV
jgi:hypothetical protein